ncbi:MAG TPA: ABC transporter substrate-binding protein [Marmoricola sp.]|nr:ABC transporter substrate-binding protein [Marmoricola sp.]
MRRTPLVAALAVTASLAFSACGSSSLTSDTHHNVGGPAKVDPASAALVPAAIKSRGTLVVGTDASYAPSEILAADGSTIQGFDIDLFTQVARTLGLKVKFENASFGTIITGVSSGKYDVGVSSFTVTLAREKQANMVSYFSAGESWAAPSGNPKNINIDNACGLNIAVQTNTTEATDIAARSAACTKAGKPAIHIDSYDKQDAATANVASGRDDAMLADSPVIAYAIKQSAGKLQQIGSVYASAPYGYVIPLSQTQLANAILSALKVLKANGLYEEALKGWGVEQGAISDFALNPTNVPAS